MCRSFGLVPTEIGEERSDAKVLYVPDAYLRSIQRHDDTRLSEPCGNQMMSEPEADLGLRHSLNAAHGA